MKWLKLVHWIISRDSANIEGLVVLANKQSKLILLIVVQFIIFDLQTYDSMLLTLLLWWLELEHWNTIPLLINMSCLAFFNVIRGGLKRCQATHINYKRKWMTIYLVLARTVVLVFIMYLDAIYKLCGVLASFAWLSYLQIVGIFG